MYARKGVEEENQNEEIMNLQQEFSEYQSQSKEYEETLEKELAEKEQKLSEYLEKYEIVSTNLENIKKKYQESETEIVKLQLEIENLKRKLKIYENQKLELEHLNDQWEKSARILEYSKQTLEEKLYQAEECAILYKEELEELSQTRLEEVQRLKDEYQELKQELIILEVTPPPKFLEKARSPTPTLKHTFETTITITRPQSKNPSRNISRKPSFDEAISKQNVKVIIVFRPPLPSETWDQHILSIDPNLITIKEKNKEIKTFEFEKILIPGTSQLQVYEEIKESVQKLYAGVSSCIMAYGQTGSGKTYTMNSLISLALAMLSETITNEYQVSLQCIEVYNEHLKNLLSDDPLNKNLKEVLNKSEVKLGNDWKNASLELVQKAISRRATKLTECNERSSRSHAIIWFTVTGPLGCGKVQFVDLAGSERIGKSQVVGDSLKEALLINKSLSALQDVISALENRQKHVPYRNSMLTKILQPTLEGSDSIVTMIMNCSPSNDSINETLCTLALGSRIKAVDLGFFIRKNLVTKEVERTLGLLEKERSEKNSLLRTLDKLQRDLESYQYAIKDRDNKINILKNRIKQKDSGVDYRNQNKKYNDLVINNKIKKSVNDNREIRVGSISPDLISPLSPNMKKASRIPTYVNLKLVKKNNKVI
jgi:Kinesin motor domain